MMAPVAPKAPEAPKEPPRMFKAKVGGEEREFSEAEVTKLLSKNGYADQAIRQAKEAMAALKKREAELAEEDGLDDEEILRRRKRDPEAFARRVLEKKLREAELTPEQRELATRDARIAELEAKQKAADAEREEAGVRELAARKQRQMETELAAAAEKAGVSKDADGFYSIYEAVKESVELGLPWDAERICETARENQDAAFKKLEASVLKGLKGKALIDRLGKPVLDEINRYQIELIRGGGAKPAASQKPAAQVDGPKYISPQELQQKMRGG